MNRLDLPPTWARAQLCQTFPTIAEVISDLSWPVEPLPVRASRPYSKHPVLQTEEFEILMMYWDPQVPTAVHDHGGGLGVILVLQGELEEERWLTAAAFMSDEAPFVHRCCAGHSMNISTPELHRVRSSHPSVPAISLHCYRYASAPMRLYDAERRCTWTAVGESGAWLPESPNLQDQELWQPQ